MSDDIKIRKFILRNFQNGIAAYQTAKHILGKYGDKGYGARTCQRWYRKFREGDFNLEIKPNHDRPKRHQPQPQPKVRNEPPPRTKNEPPPRNRNEPPPRNRNEPPPRNRNEPPPRNRNEPPQKIRNEPPQIPSKLKAKLMQKRPVTIESSKFREDKTENPQLKSVVQNIIEKKREITVTKWEAKTVPLKELLAKANVITKRFSMPAVKPSLGVHGQKSAAKRMSTSALPTRTHHSPIRLPGRVRTGDDLEADLKLTPSMAKRLRPSLTSAERYDGPKILQKTGETAKKSMTVQFQNVSPDLAKNTVRKPSEALVNGTKRLSTAQSNPLSSPKGVIYLNPQEIFRQRFGLENKQPVTKKPLPKLVPKLPAKNKAKGVAPPAAPQRPSQSPVVVTESDSEDDLVFPKDVVLPPPKVKAVVDTFTTYWDMETGTPILLNPTADVIPTLPVIEID